VSEANAREIVVETTKVKAVFSNHGATIVHWILKEYRTDSGQPLDLVPGGAGADAIKPFTLTVDDQAISTRLKDAVYRVTVNGSPAGEMVDATASPQTIVFETASADGLNVKKAFSVEPTSYIVSFGAVVEMGGQRQKSVIHWGPGLGDDIARSKPAYSSRRVTTRRHRRLFTRTARSSASRTRRRHRKARSATPASTITTSSRCC
jgi:YidC/Oxa1 family membrane protein insertase